MKTSPHLVWTNTFNNKYQISNDLMELCVDADEKCRAVFDSLLEPSNANLGRKW